MSEVDDFFGKPGESVPVVDAADIKAMWAYCQKLRSEHPECAGGGVAIGMCVWKQILAPGVDIRAVNYRFSMLGLLEVMLQAAWTLGEPTENTFKVVARMDLKWAQVGVPQNGLPFELF